MREGFALSALPVNLISDTLSAFAREYEPEAVTTFS